MTALMKIQSFIQAYVKAIASILDVDVTIVDNELVLCDWNRHLCGRDWRNCDSREFFFIIFWFPARAAVLWTAWRI